MIANPTQPFRVRLEVRRVADTDSEYRLRLASVEPDPVQAEGIFRFDELRETSTGTWSEFLARYENGQLADDKEASQVFGQSLHDALINESDLRGAWDEILARVRASSRPLGLSVVPIGEDAIEFMHLPLELIVCGGAFLFLGGEDSLERQLFSHAPKVFRPQPKPRVVFAWAEPDGREVAHAQHLAFLEQLFPTRLLELRHAGIRELASAIVGHRPHYVYLLAHGDAGSLLLGRSTAPERVDADLLTRELNLSRVGTVELFFLCLCNSAVDGSTLRFSAAAHQLLSPQGGDLPCVVANQAKISVAGGEKLGYAFFKELVATDDALGAMAQARVELQHEFSVPVLLTRAPLTTRDHPHGEFAGRLLRSASDQNPPISEFVAPPGSSKSALILDVKERLRRNDREVLDIHVDGDGFTGFWRQVVHQLEPDDPNPPTEVDPQRVIKLLKERPRTTLLVRWAARHLRDRLDERDAPTAIGRDLKTWLQKLLQTETPVLLIDRIELRAFMVDGIRGSATVHFDPLEGELADSWDDWSRQLLPEYRLHDEARREEVDELADLAARQPEAFRLGLAEYVDAGFEQARARIRRVHDNNARLILDSLPNGMRERLVAGAEPGPWMEPLQRAAILRGDGTPVVERWGAVWRAAGGGGE